jgi:hypothetical protein
VFQIPPDDRCVMNTQSVGWFATALSNDTKRELKYHVPDTQARLLVEKLYDKCSHKWQPPVYYAFTLERIPMCPHTRAQFRKAGWRFPTHRPPGTSRYTLKWWPAVDPLADYVICIDVESDNTVKAKAYQSGRVWISMAGAPPDLCARLTTESTSDLWEQFYKFEVDHYEEYKLSIA